jgi:NADH dehydrogenase FAD-containing subunit
MSLGSVNAAVALPVPLPLPFKTTLQNSPLGPFLEASGIKLGGNDPENGVTLEGPLAAVIRRAAYLYRQPTNEQRLNVATSWIQQALLAAGTAPANR